MNVLTGQWRKGDPCYKVAERLAELCSFEWKVELTSSELVYVAETISKPCVESAEWFLLVGYTKM